MVKFNVSNSLINGYMEYMNGERCGKLFLEESVLKNVSTPATPAMLKGKRFEHLSTGAKNRDGSVTGPLLTGSGKNSADEVRAIKQATRFHDAIAHYEIDVKDVDVTLIYDLDGINVKGVIDIDAERHNKPLIIDLKYSGLLYNKWEKFGWGMETLGESHHISQAKIYKYLMFKLHGIVDVPFWFMVYSSSNEFDAEIFKIEYSDPARFHFMIEEVERNIKYVYDSIKYLVESDLFQYYPSIKNCKDCPLRDECKMVMNVPTINNVIL